MAKTIQQVEQVTIRFAGDSGDGMQLTGTRFTSETALFGNDLSTLPDFPAEIRAPAGTTFGVSAFQIHFGASEVRTAGDAATLWRWVKDGAGDLVITDVVMPGMGGMEAIRRLLAVDARARILVLSFYDSWVIPTRVLKAGAKGYLSKRSAPDQLIDAVRRLAAGQSYIEPRIAQSMAEQAVFGDKEPIERLTRREFEVFQLLASGERAPDIADKLHLSLKTVGTHRTRIMKKLEASTLADLARLAFQYGLLERQ